MSQLIKGDAKTKLFVTSFKVGLDENLKSNITCKYVEFQSIFVRVKQRKVTLQVC